MKIRIALSAAVAAFVLINASTASAWDYEGHRVVNQLALASLPTNFPAFVRAPEAAERVAFLAGEADRWRNTPDLPLQHCQEPEHFMDIEELAQFGLNADMLPVFRYDFVSQVAAARKAHPEIAAGSNDPAHKHGWIGLLPWAITENYGKLKSGFSYLKAFEQNHGTPEEITNAQANILAFNNIDIGGNLAVTAAANELNHSGSGVNASANLQVDATHGHVNVGGDIDVSAIASFSCTIPDAPRLKSGFIGRVRSASRTYSNVTRWRTFRLFGCSML